MHANATESTPVVTAKSETVTASGKPVKPKRTREKRVCRLQKFMPDPPEHDERDDDWKYVQDEFADETDLKKYVRDSELEGKFRPLWIGKEFTAAKVTKTTVKLS